ncbi:MAG: hypothetical protein KY054_01650 [Candidatus Nealsonbacteria bacterium]|nr:hypothetical protein [Candidatus Nealsonbacteria bacterium]
MNNKLRMSKTNIIIGLLSILLIISLSFISVIIWRNTKNFLISQGYAMAVSNLIDAAENEDCAPFPVHLEERSVQLINIDCLTPDEAEI